MINYGLRNNLPSNTLYNSQVASLVFCCSIAFKLSSLPGLVAKIMHSSTLWAYLLMAAIEIICFTGLYVFSRHGGDEFLTETRSKIYKIILVFFMLYLLAKSTIYFSYVALFLTNELFIQATPALFFIVFLVPVLYLGIKGARTIARTSEIFTILLFLGVIINLAFLKSDIDFGRNLPILALEPSDFFTNSFRYGLWLGDLMPIIFIKMQQKKVPYIGISVGVSAVLILISVALGISMYGDAMPFVANMLVEIAGFNQLSLEIGRMEWISLFIVVTMAIFTMSLLFWGVLSCSERIFKSRKPMMFMYPTILIIVLFTAPSMQSIANVAFTNLGYVAFAFAVIFPLVLLLTLALAKKRHHIAKPKNIESEGSQEINTDSINTEAKTPASTSSSPLNQ